MSCPSNLVFNINTLKCETNGRVPKACSSNPCLNGGKCVDLPFFQYKCECQVGFSGQLCEQTDGCAVSSCGKFGTCIPSAAGSPISNICLCNNGKSYGFDCETRIVDNPCMNNGQDLEFFASPINPAVFVHCEGRIPHLKFCNYPLTYNANFQRCDW